MPETPETAMRPEVVPDAETFRATVRAKVAKQLRRAAEGRRHYAASWPEGDQTRLYLEAEAHAFDSAAKLAEGDVGTMLALLPTLMWNDEETAHARGEQT